MKLLELNKVYELNDILKNDNQNENEIITLLHKNKDIIF